MRHWRCSRTKSTTTAAAQGHPPSTSLRQPPQAQTANPSGKIGALLAPHVRTRNALLRGCLAVRRPHALHATCVRADSAGRHAQQRAHAPRWAIRYRKSRVMRQPAQDLSVAVQLPLMRTSDQALSRLPGRLRAPRRRGRKRCPDANQHHLGCRESNAAVVVIASPNDHTCSVKRRTLTQSSPCA